MQSAGLGGLHDVERHDGADAEIGQPLEHLDRVEHPVGAAEGAVVMVLLGVLGGVVAGFLRHLCSRLRSSQRSIHRRVV